MHRVVLFALACSCTLAAQDWVWEIPPGFPKPWVPADNPMSAAKVELGRRLFYDRRLSGNGTQSCASCHQQELAFTDGKPRGVGSTGEVHPRGAMSLANIAYAPRLTWAHPSLWRLEEQALAPMFGEAPVELGLKGHEARLEAMFPADSVYAPAFREAFPGEARPHTMDNAIRAIASFQRSIVSARSPYDRYRWGRDETAISEAAKRGEFLFFSGEKAGCFQCHGGPNFSGGLLHAGAPEPPAAFHHNGLRAAYEAPNTGTHEHTRAPGDIGRFRTPTLRNIAVTAPYMHDGSLATLADVVEHYASGGYAHPNRSPAMRPLELTEAEKADLIAFLESLTDEELLRDPRWSDPWPSPGRQREPDGGENRGSR